MKGPARLTDEQIERLLRARAAAPDWSLLDEILAAVDTVPQRRSPWPMPLTSSRRALLLMAAALLLAALAGAIAIGSGIIRAPDPPGTVVGRSQCGLATVDPASGQAGELIPDLPECELVIDVAWASEAGILAYSVDDPIRDRQTPTSGVWLLDQSTGANRQVLRCGEEAEECWALDIAADGSRLAVVSIYPLPAATDGAEPRTASRLRIVDLEGDSAVSRDLALPAADVRFSPDGELIAVAARANPEPGTLNGLYLLDADGSEPRPIFERAGVHVDGASWSPDGDRLAVTTTDTRSNELGVWVIGADGSSPTQIAALRPNMATQVAEWSPTGDLIAFGHRYPIDAGGEESGGEGWEAWVIGADGDPQAVVYESCCNAAGAGPVWSPDGRYLAFGSGQAVMERPEPWSLYVVRVDGTEVRRVSDVAALLGWFDFR